MAQKTKESLAVVELKCVDASRRPYNKFQIKDKPEKEEDKILAHPKLMGLNVDLLRDCRRCQPPRPPLKAAYCGHFIGDSIRSFNETHKTRCRKLVYDLRHGEADHNAWKEVWTAKYPGQFVWTKGPEYKRQPNFSYEGRKYCIIDPPLTGQGVEQAKEANEAFGRLRDLGFPMPKKAFVSPLYRALMTFKYGLKGMFKEGYILDNLREQKTGNCADILWKEYHDPANPIKPPQAGTGGSFDWMEDDEKDGKDDKFKCRLANLHAEIFRKDGSDCIVRVTHSLLIRHNLMGLASSGAELLHSFMLDEGGLFAYVIEGDCPTDTMKGTPVVKMSDHEEVTRTRKTAFPNHKAPLTPRKADPKPTQVITKQNAVSSSQISVSQVGTAALPQTAMVSMGSGGTSRELHPIINRRKAQGSTTSNGTGPPRPAPKAGNKAIERNAKGNDNGSL